MAKKKKPLTNMRSSDYVVVVTRVMSIPPRDHVVSVLNVVDNHCVVTKPMSKADAEQAQQILLSLFE